MVVVVDVVLEYRPSETAILGRLIKVLVEQTDRRTDVTSYRYLKILTYQYQGSLRPSHIIPFLPPVRSAFSLYLSAGIFHKLLVGVVSVLPLLRLLFLFLSQVISDAE